MTFMDPILMAQKAEQEGRLPFIMPDPAMGDGSGFWVDYVPQPDGSMKEIERVQWVKRGQQNRTAVPMRVADYLKRPDNPEWLVLKPYYDAWKEGRKAPLNGTPLEAWPGATKELIKALASVHIRTIEDFCQMEDSAIQRLNVPSLRDKQMRCRQFREAQTSTAPLAEKVSKLTEENQFLKNEIAELKALINSASDKADVEIAADKPRRGRPPGAKNKVRHELPDDNPERMS